MQGLCGRGGVNMKRKIIFTILIVIILVNVLEIINSKDTYIYGDENNWIYVNDYERCFDMLCKFENEDIATLSNTYYCTSKNDPEHRYKVACWEFEAKSEGTTKVYLYRVITAETDFEELTYDEAIDVITLTVDESNRFVQKSDFYYMYRKFGWNFQIIGICIFLMIIPYINYFRDRKRRIKIFNILMIFVYAFDILFYWILNILEMYSILIIFFIVSSIFLTFLYSKLYNKQKIVFKIVLLVVGLHLALIVFLSITWFLSVIVQVFYLFVIAFILYCCGSKGQVKEYL